MTRQASPATSWERRSVAHWRDLWQVPDLVVFHAVGSTNDVARACAADGAPAGTVVIADVQTAGRGQAGRSWYAEPACGLLLSVVFRPAAAHDAEPAPGATPIRIGLRAAAAIEAVTGVACGLKWPNDLIVPDRGKVGGVLCEAAAIGADWVVIAGIGINVRPPADGWPPDLLSSAVALDEVAATTTDRAHLAGRLVAALLPLARAPLLPLDTDELAEFERRDVLRDRSVVVQPRDPAAASASSGIAAGIDPDGALLVESRGHVRRVVTGTVRPGRAARRAAPRHGTPRQSRP